ncbi:alpha/beta fold hydrolase [Conexibacter sp. DBS9H8]|uniref:alpha/beta fold hydrolase n=1 Tax=Conexibacter sp. DBS9H8 TaxID=2937801 RepID=UPI00200FB73D|nr:alpha/beta fold hydrolase [Conexibacter sp. DBS9H8]
MGELSPALYRAGSGEPVVLLHGFTGHWRHWRPVLADLVARYEVIAPALSGHQGGPAYPAGIGLDRLADAGDSLEQHLDELGVHSAHLIGNSMGGALALELAKRGRARSVVAFSPGGGWEIGGPEPARIADFFARQMRMIRASQGQVRRVMARPGARRLALRDIMRHGELVNPAEAAALSLDPLACTVVDDVLASLRAGHAHVEDLHTIAAPTLIAWAEHDRILPLAGCATRFRREIPGVRFEILPGVGHVPMWDDPIGVTATICRWVDAHTGAALTA